MKYFTRELWRQINSEQESERIAAEQQWNKNDERYCKYISKIRSKLSSYIRLFLNRSMEFHDAPITEITFSQRGTEKTCRMKLDMPSGEIEMILHDVSSYVVSLTSFQSAVAGQLNWGFSEIKHTAGNRYRLSIAFDLDNELEVEFKSLEFMP